MSNASDFIIENGVLTKYNGKASAIVIPEGVTEIGAEAFAGQKKIVEITVPGAVTKIGYNTFKGCSTLIKVEIQNPEAEAYDCFSGCKLLSYISASEKTMEGVLRFCSTKMKSSLCYGYLRSNDSNRVYEDNAKRLKKHMIAQAVEEDCAAAIAKLFACYKKPIAINEIDEYLVAAAEKTNITAFLLEYKQRHYSAQQIDKNAEVNAEKELGVRPRSLAEWRKVFAISVRGKEITLERYKLNESTVEIPTTIEGKTVTEMQGTFEQQEYVKTIALPSQLQILGWNVCEGTSISEITIPETVEEIGMFAFADCSQLQKVVFCGAGEIEIDETAFERSEKIVIYAPAGSYAETYAKENNIPFVEE